MSQIHYLTVQDLIWINQQITKSAQPFQYAHLEDAISYQYSYGAAKGVLPQAASFLKGIQKLDPFAKGSKATAFVATLAFLSFNGYHPAFDDRDGARWMERFDGKAESLKEAGHEHGATLKAIVGDILSEFSGTIAAL